MDCIRKGERVVRKLLGRRFACIMAILLATTNIMMFPNDAQAADSDAGQEVVYQQYTELKDVEAYFGIAAPTYKSKDGREDRYGYLFGGWFTKVNVEGVGERFKPIKSDELYEASTNKENSVKLSDATNYYAKFVPAYVLGVKCQNNFGTKVTTDNTGKTEMRMVSSLDSTNYSYFGFKLSGLSIDADGNLDEMGNSLTVDLKGDKKIFWEKLFVHSSSPVEGEAPQGTKYPPSTVLGTAGKYFMVHRLSVSEKNYGRTYSIQPFWVTFDGVTVYGLTKYAHIEDGIYGYVNIPVNLKNNNDVAGGVVEFDWSDLQANGYTFKGAECGKLFKVQRTKELDAVDNAQIIRCLSVVDITGSNAGSNVDSDDIFINLRFEKSETTQPKGYNGTFYHFGVNGEDFSDISENTIAEYDVWDIQY